MASLAADTSCARLATRAPGRTHTSPLSGASCRVISCSSEDLPSPLRPEQAHAFALADLQVDAIQQGFEAEAQRDFVEADGGHEAAYGKRLRLNNPATRKSRRRAAPALPAMRPRSVHAPVTVRFFTGAQARNTSSALFSRNALPDCSAYRDIPRPAAHRRSARARRTLPGSRHSRRHRRRSRAVRIDWPGSAARSHRAIRLWPAERGEIHLGRGEIEYRHPRRCAAPTARGMPSKSRVRFHCAPSAICGHH